jgi:hypothetical protein
MQVCTIPKGTAFVLTGTGQILMEIKSHIHGSKNEHATTANKENSLLEYRQSLTALCFDLYIHN